MTKWRRSIIYSAATFVRIRNYCRREGIPLAWWVDKIANAELDKKGEKPTFQDEAVAELREARGLRRVLP